METTRSVWRSLRPVLLAVVVATSWMAFSASAATADSSSETDALLKNVGSSVTMLTTTATDQAGGILLPAPNEAPRFAGAGPVAAAASTNPAFAPGPVIHEVPRAGDGPLQSVPVVADLLPTGPLTEITAPVANIAGSMVGATAGSILPQAGAVGGVFEPVWEPIIDLGVVPGTPALLDISLDGPVLDGGEKDSSGVTRNGFVPGSADGALPAFDRAVFESASAPIPTVIASQTGTGTYASSAPCGELQPRVLAAAAAAEVVPPAYPDGEPLGALPDVMPAVPGSGAAGSSGPGGGPSAPVWLAAHHLEIPPITAVPILGALLSSPSPVSFDPGSSPD